MIEVQAVEGGTKEATIEALDRRKDKGHLKFCDEFIN